MSKTPALLSSLCLTALALGGCNQTGAPAASAVPGATPTSFRMPEGSGCAGEVGRFRAVVDNDVRIGHLNRAVHDGLSSELDRAEAACAAGRDAEATRMVVATRARYGYR